MKASIEQLLENLFVLESSIGGKVKYTILDPFPINSADIISIQDATKKIAAFIGLQNLTFIVGIAKQKENVGGHIELSGREQEVFIELSENVLKYPETVLSTLAHEVTHKYLELNGIRHPNDMKNEILTDTASVYLGFGEIMLNGCERYTVRHEKDWQEEKTITETLTTGYLDREGFAFVYNMVCIMRKIIREELEAKLSNDSRQSLNDCRRSYYQYFDNRINSKVALLPIVKDLEDEIKDLQYILSNIEKGYFYIQKVGLGKIEEFLKNNHNELMGMCCEIEKILGKETVNPSLAYLEVIIARQELLKNKDKIANRASEFRSLQNITEKIGKKISESSHFPKPSPEMFNVVTCWNCMAKLRLPLNTCRLIGKCPKCSYQFATDTSAEPVRISSKIRFKRHLSNIGKKIISFYH